jgi:hypothetical protein
MLKDDRNSLRAVPTTCLPPGNLLSIIDVLLSKFILIAIVKIYNLD